MRPDPRKKQQTASATHATIAAAVLALLAGSAIAVPPDALPVDEPPSILEGPEARIDESSEDAAASFFDRLVERYRALQEHREEARVEEVVTDLETGDEAVRTVVRLKVEIADGELDVTTSNAVDAVLDSMTAGEDSIESDLRLLPHLRLHFSDRPLEDLGKGSDVVFRPVEIERFESDDRDLVRLRLLAGETASPVARIEIVVDPSRMLVERIEGESWPSGMHRRTEVEIDIEFGTESGSGSGPRIPQADRAD